MTQLIVDLARSEQAVSRIKDYASRFISNLLEGNSNNWVSFKAWWKDVIAFSKRWLSDQLL